MQRVPAVSTMAKTIAPRRAFQMTLELFPEASFKKILYAVWCKTVVANCVTRE